METNEICCPYCEDDTLANEAHKIAMAWVTFFHYLFREEI